jgi:DNA-binding NtrC family response regulator
MSVLVVDSDTIFQESVINHLLIYGVNCFEVISSGQEAMERLSKKMFDVIIINFQLPDISGLQIAKEFKNRKPDSKIILVIDDDQFSAINGNTKSNLNFPTILKSEVEPMLPQLVLGS